MNHPKHRIVSWLSSVLPERLKRTEQEESTPDVSSWLKSSKLGTDEEWQSKLQKCRERGKVANDSKEVQRAALLSNKEELAVQLPACPESQRIAPNAILRSAIFGVVKRGKRRFVEGKTPLAVSSWSGSSIKYFGQQLDQYDLDVWLQALHLARQQDLSDTKGIHFTARSFLKSMGRKYSGCAADTLFRSLQRMVGCAITVEIGDMLYMGSLIHGCTKDKATQTYVLRLNPKLRDLFDTGTTKMDWVTRQALPADLARWMHGYVLSHKATRLAPHRISIDALKGLSGADVAVLRDFKKPLRRAMRALTELKALVAWRFTEGDALEFVRPDPFMKEPPNLLPGHQ
jgi:hypothetical protein